MDTPIPDTPPAMPSVASPKNIAVFGLGIIGSRVADILADSDHQVGTWSQNPRNRTDFEHNAARLATQSDVLLLFLKDAPAIRATFDVLRPHLSPGKTVVNHATIDLETTAFLAKECETLGCSFLNAPFTGSKIAAGKGNLVYYAGGNLKTLDSVRPVLELTSQEIIPMESAAQATVVKLTTNLVTACTVQALAESLRISNAHGVTAETLLSAIQGNACGSVLAGMKIPTMAEEDYDPHFSLSNMLKDSRYAIDLAERANLDTPSLRCVSNLMADLDAQGHGDQDFSILNSQFNGK